MYKRQELVSDLTANAFIAALRRFMSRRGIPSQLYSDNGTIFRKARNVLHDLYNLWHNKDATSSIQSFTTSQGITSVSYTHLDVYKRQVLSALTHKLPAQSFDINHFNVPDNVFLADPHFNISADIDILLAAQFYLDLILPNKYVCGSHFPIIQETKLGYILPGNLPKHCHYKGPAVSILARNNDSQILASLEKFLETETPVSYTHLDVYKRQVFGQIACKNVA